MDLSQEKDDRIVKLQPVDEKKASTPSSTPPVKPVKRQATTKQLEHLAKARNKRTKKVKQKEIMNKYIKKMEELDIVDEKDFISMFKNMDSLKETPAHTQNVYDTDKDDNVAPKQAYREKEREQTYTQAVPEVTRKTISQTPSFKEAIEEPGSYDIFI